VGWGAGARVLGPMTHSTAGAVPRADPLPCAGPADADGAVRSDGPSSSGPGRPARASAPAVGAAERRAGPPGRWRTGWALIRRTGQHKSESGRQPGSDRPAFGHSTGPPPPAGLARPSRRGWHRWAVPLERPWERDLPAPSGRRTESSGAHLAWAQQGLIRAAQIHDVSHDKVAGARSGGLGLSCGGDALHTKSYTLEDAVALRSDQAGRSLRMGAAILVKSCSRAGCSRV
jgi:hypothetical protein